MARRIESEPEVDPFVSIDDRGAPVGPIRSITLALKGGAVHPSPIGTVVTLVDSFGRSVRRVPSDAVIFGDPDAVEQWQLTERETPEQLRAEIVAYLDREASRRRKGRAF